MERSRSYKIVVNREEGSGEEQPPVVRRKREKIVGGGVSTLPRRKTLHKTGRRISCVDLGQGTHSGWLRARKPRKTKWDECHKWCVIKEADLFVYASKMDTVATSRIHLPMFTVSEAKETKKTGAFKIQNSGTTFYFRSKTEEEKYEWINHLSLAAIGFKTTENEMSQAASIGSSSGVDSSYSTSNSQAYSDVDDDCSSVGEEPPQVIIRPKTRSVSLYPTKRLKSHIDVNKDLRKMVTSIREADLDIVGMDRDTRRQSQMRKSLAQAGFTHKSTTKNKRLFILRAKERQKQALEQELADINDILTNCTHSNLQHFLSRYPDYQDDISLDSHLEGDQSSSERSSKDSATILTPCSIDSSCTLVEESDRDTLSSALTELSIEGQPDDDRQTLVADTEMARLVAPETDTLDSSSGASNRSSREMVFSKQKYKQTVTYL